jgi:hypothetical protein
MPEGAEVEIPGLGVFKNGSRTPVAPEQIEVFQAHHGRVVDLSPAEDQAKGLAAVGFQQGPTLHAAFKDHPFIDVLVEEEEKPEKATKKESPPAKTVKVSKEEK